MTEAEAAKSDLEGKIAELEKRLMEEREKVLLASLRSKEEEAVSAKVETSIKDIQDKLRREKREQELEENRRKAEARAMEMERRMAEEREAWVATLKGQLNQRDQATQEMELHFAARLKDLEYRWSQEKTVLEAALKEREGELSRLRQEFALKSEHEKAFWEDRVKTAMGEREKLDRELERMKDRFQQEKEQLVFERQTLREQVGQLDSSLKFVEEQSRTEKSALQRQMESAITQLNQQVQNQARELVERHAETQTLKNQSASQQISISQLQAQLEETRQAHKSAEADFHVKRKRLEAEIEEIGLELRKERERTKAEAVRFQSEADARVRSLQTRLDWYDSNVKREYELARDKVRLEVEQLQTQLADAQRRLEERTGSEGHETQILSEQVKSLQERLQQSEQSRVTLENEIKQRDSQAEFNKSILQNRQDELERATAKQESLQRLLEQEREKAAQLQSQIESFRETLHGRGVQMPEDLKEELAAKSADTEKLKLQLQRLKDMGHELQKKEELFVEKEQVLRQVISDKEESMTDLKNKTRALERKMAESGAEMEAAKADIKKDAERLVRMKEQELEERLATQKKEMAEQMEAKRRAQAEVPAGPTPQAIEAQIRQQLEMETTDRLREQQGEWEKKVAAAREETKKEADRLRWENESLKEEVKRARDARVKLEREAQELLQQAEEHYNTELEKHAGELEKKAKSRKGFFTAIGNILDTPIIDTKKNKDDEPAA